MCASINKNKPKVIGGSKGSSRKSSITGSARSLKPNRDELVKLLNEGTKNSEIANFTVTVGKELKPKEEILKKPVEKQMNSQKTVKKVQKNKTSIFSKLLNKIKSLIH
uniref:Uncharacterized protein n=1 Tax=Theileria annulata TaxID=5874 RepID=A0A3B0MXZ3_THEAN